jgi:hypothetical protein
MQHPKNGISNTIVVTICQSYVPTVPTCPHLYCHAHHTRDSCLAQSLVHTEHGLRFVPECPQWHTSKSIPAAGDVWHSAQMQGMPTACDEHVPSTTPASTAPGLVAGCLSLPYVRTTGGAASSCKPRRSTATAVAGWLYTNRTICCVKINDAATTRSWVVPHKRRSMAHAQPSYSVECKHPQQLPQVIACILQAPTTIAASDCYC